MTICDCCSRGLATRTALKCGRLIERQTVQQMVDQITSYPKGTRVMVLAPLVKDRKGEYRQIFEDVRKAGLRSGAGQTAKSATPRRRWSLDRYKKHSIEVVIDRLVVEDDIAGRLADSLETALKLGERQRYRGTGGRPGDPLLRIVCLSV